MSSQDDDDDDDDDRNWNRMQEWQLETSFCLSLELGSETSGRIDSPSTQNALSYSLSPLSVATQESGNVSKENHCDLHQPERQQGEIKQTDNVDLSRMTFLDAALHDPNYASTSDMEEFLGNQQQLPSPIAMKRESFDDTHCAQRKESPLTRLGSEAIGIENNQTTTKETLKTKSQEIWCLQEQQNHEELIVYQFVHHNHWIENQEIYTNTTTSTLGKNRGDEIEVIHGVISSSPVPIDNAPRKHSEQEKSQQLVSSTHSLDFRNKDQPSHTNKIYVASDPTNSFKFDNLQHRNATIKGAGNEQSDEDRDQDQENNTNSKHEQANERKPVKIIHEACYSSDLTSAKKHIDASSLMFTETLRGAARRRKQEVTRSRDSLAAKEKEQLLSIAESRERQRLRLALAKVDDIMTLQKISAAKQESITRLIGYKPFKARPMIQSGRGGLVGISKVEKKPSTIPFSPQLGAKRQQKLRVLALEKGQGGQFGVPKVEKKHATIPVSPHLGLRRQTQSLSSQRFQTSSKNVLAIEQHQNPLQSTTNLMYGLVKARKISHTTRRLRKQNSDGRRTKQFPDRSASNLNTSICSLESNSDLCGLRLLNDQSSPNKRIYIGPVIVGKNTPPTNLITPRNAKIPTFSLHSTERARIRAQFDVRQLEIQEMKLAVKKVARTALLIAKRKEVNYLRESLRQLP